jgi:hypothetical protein
VSVGIESIQQLSAVDSDRDDAAVAGWVETARIHREYVRDPAADRWDR